MATVPQGTTSRNGQAIAALTGYEDAETLAWDRACVEAADRLTATPTALLATAEKSRLARGLDLARHGAVVVYEDGTIDVPGADCMYTWRLAGHCPCPDHTKYPQGLCKHMIAHLIHQEALSVESVTPTITVASLPPAGAPAAPAAAPGVSSCPESCFSLCIKGHLQGVEAQLTIRGQTATEFLANVQAVRGLLDAPVREKSQTAEPEPEVEQHVCAYHGPLKPSTKAPGTWFCPGKMADGSYCKARFPEAQAPRGGK